MMKTLTHPTTKSKLAVVKSLKVTKEYEDVYAVGESRIVLYTVRIWHDDNVLEIKRNLSLW